MDRLYARNNYGSIIFGKTIVPIIESLFLDPTNTLKEKSESYHCKALECLYAIFIRNSLSLFNSCSQSIELSQSLFTIRYIIEIVADTAYLSKHPDNIKRFRTIYKKYQKTKISGITELGDYFEKFIICRSNKDGNIQTKTLERIECSLDEKTTKIYKFLCGFTHVNYMAALMDMNFAEKGNLQSFLFLRPILGEYPKYLETMLKASFVLSGQEYDLGFDKKIEENFGVALKSIERLLAKAYLQGGKEEKIINIGL